MMIRRLYGQEVLDALHLVWDVFVVDVAPCYTQEGVAAFSQFIRYENIEKKMRTEGMAMFGAFDEIGMKGVGAIHPSGHIALLFVRKEEQKKGIGRQLFQAMCSYGVQTFRVSKITVNASPGSVEAYRRFGMRDAAPEQTGDGIQYTPLEMWITPAAPVKKDNKKIYLIIGAAVVCFLVFVLSAVAVVRQVRYVVEDHTESGGFPGGDYGDDYGGDFDDYFDGGWYDQMPDWYGGYGSDDGDYDDDMSGINAIDAYVSDHAKYEVTEENYSYAPDDTTSTVIQFEVVYPQIQGLDESVQKKINQALEDCAMETVDKLYLNPSQEMKEKVLSEESPVLASMVGYKVTYQGEHLLSVAFEDYGYEGNMDDSYTSLRCLNFNLEDGSVYDVKDIVELNDGFIDLWLEEMRDEADEDTLLSELDNEELKEVLGGDSKDGCYEDNFFVDDEGIEIGLSFRYEDSTQDNTRFAWVTAPFDLDDLKPYETDSSFWKHLES